QAGDGGLVASVESEPVGSVRPPRRGVPAVPELRPPCPPGDRASGSRPRDLTSATSSQPLLPTEDRLLAWPGMRARGAALVALLFALSLGPASNDSPIASAASALPRFTFVAGEGATILVHGPYPKVPAPCRHPLQRSP